MAERATSRAVCLALALALVRFGVPQEILSDNGKQFTDRFGKGGEVLFDKICRKNGITHRLTAPASPNQNGKVERFHLTLRREFLDGAGPFESVELAQAALDGWVAGYNADRPHQGLDEHQPVLPSERFAPLPEDQRGVVQLWLPPALGIAPETTGTTASGEQDVLPPQDGWAGGPVELDRVIPPSGNLMVARRQFWLSPLRAGQVARFWADVDVIHVSIGGSRVKSVRSHLSVNDLAALFTRESAINAGPSPLPAAEDGDAVEVDRVVSRLGLVSLGNRQLLAAEIHGGRQVGIRIEEKILMFFDLHTRTLLRTRPNPLTAEQVSRLRGLRKAGPPPRPSTEPVTVQRRASNTGVVMVCGQKVALGRAHQHQTVTIAVSETTLVVDLGDGESRVRRRTTNKPARSIKGARPRAVGSG